MKRVTVILLAIAVYLLVATLYAGENWLPFFAVLAGDGLAALLWTISAGMLGFVLLRPLRIGGHPALVLATCAAAGLGAYSLFALFLGLLGWLNRGVAISMGVAGAALFVATVFIRHGNVSTQSFRERIEAWLNSRFEAWWALLILIVFFAIASVAATAPPGVLWRSAGDPHPFDVVEYHLQIPREWYELGRIVPLRHNAFSFFPFNVEMQYLLGMHLLGGPWKGMYMAQFMSLSYGMIAVVAVYGTARQLRGRESSPIPAVCAALLVGTSPWVLFLSSIAYNESGLLLYGALAIGWTLRFARMPDDKEGAGGDPRHIAVAGLMAGFAAGAKYTAIPMLILAIPLALILIPWRESRIGARRLLVGCAIFAGTAVSVLSPWLIRNLAWSGNPVFPEAMRLLGRAHFSETQQVRWEQAHAPAPEHAAPQRRMGLFASEILFDRRYAYGLWALMPAAAVIGILSGRREVWLLVVLFGALCLFWLLFTHLQSRFFVMGVPMAALVVGLIPSRPVVNVGLGIAVVVISLFSFAIVHAEIVDPRQKANELLGLTDYTSGRDREIRDLIQSGGKIALVGDAQAFMYQVPTANLKYRTVFDVDDEPGMSVVSAFLGPDASAIRREHHIIINPVELRRYLQTYHMSLRLESLPSSNNVQIIPPSGR